MTPRHAFGTGLLVLVLLGLPVTVDASIIGYRCVCVPHLPDLGDVVTYTGPDLLTDEEEALQHLEDLAHEPLAPPQPEHELVCVPVEEHEGAPQEGSVPESSPAVLMGAAAVCACGRRRRVRDGLDRIA